MHRTIIICCVVLLGVTPLAAQHRHYIVPVLALGEADDLGLAFTNPSTDELSITLTARSYTGTLIGGSAITNPASLQIPPNSQKALRASEIFGIGVQRTTGWLDIETPASGIKGFFLLFNAGLTLIDGAELLERPSRRLVFPRVSTEAPDGSTLTFVNTSSQTVAGATLSLPGTNFRQVLDLAPNSGFSGSIIDMFPDARFDGYAVLELPSNAPETLIGMISYKRGSDMAVLPALTETSRLRYGYIPHIVAGGGYDTRVVLINDTNSPQPVKITAAALDQAGHGTPFGSVSVDRLISPSSMAVFSASSLFGLSAVNPIAGYLQWEVPAATEGLLGYVDYGTTDGVLLSAVVAQPVTSTEFFFSHLAQGQGFYTGLALLNTTSTTSAVTVTAYLPAGEPIGFTTFSLGPGERRTNVISELIAETSNHLGGYVRVNSNQPLLAIEVFGSSESLQFLANVPAQANAAAPVVQPAPPGPPANIRSELLSLNTVPNQFVFSVTITDAAQKPVSSVPVTFTRTSGRGTIRNLSLLGATSASGLAGALITLASTLDVDTYEASVTGSNLKVSVTAAGSSSASVSVPPPAVTSVEPSSVPIGAANFEVILTGTNLDSVIEVILRTPSSIISKSATQIKVHVNVPSDSAVGFYNLGLRTAATSYFSQDRGIFVTTRAGISVRGFVVFGNSTTSFATVGAGGQSAFDLIGPAADRIRRMYVANDPAISITGSSPGSDRYQCTFKAAPTAVAGYFGRSVTIETDEGSFPTNLFLSVYSQDSAIAPATFRPDTAPANATTHVAIYIAGSYLPTGFYFLKDGVYDPDLLVTNFQRTNISTFETDITIAADAAPGPRTLVVMISDTAAGAVVSNTTLKVTSP